MKMHLKIHHCLNYFQIHIIVSGTQMAQTQMMKQKSSVQADTLLKLHKSCCWTTMRKVSYSYVKRNLFRELVKVRFSVVHQHISIKLTIKMSCTSAPLEKYELYCSVSAPHKKCSVYCNASAHFRNMYLKIFKFH